MTCKIEVVVVWTRHEERSVCQYVVCSENGSMEAHEVKRERGAREMDGMH